MKQMRFRLRPAGFRSIGNELLEVRGDQREEPLEATRVDRCGEEPAAADLTALLPDLVKRTAQPSVAATHKPFHRGIGKVGVSAERINS
jgi:hypothetical protein